MYSIIVDASVFMLAAILAEVFYAARQRSHDFSISAVVLCTCIGAVFGLAFATITPNFIKCGSYLPVYQTRVANLSMSLRSNLVFGTGTTNSEIGYTYTEIDSNEVGHPTMTADNAVITITPDDRYVAVVNVFKWQLDPKWRHWLIVGDENWQYDFYVPRSYGR
jgi:hypothetical protein